MPKNQMFCTRHIFFGDVGDLGILKSHINPHSIPIQTNKTSKLEKCKHLQSLYLNLIVYSKNQV